MQTTIVIMLGLVLIFQLVQMTIAGSSGGDGFNMQDRIDLFTLVRRTHEITAQIDDLMSALQAIALDVGQKAQQMLDLENQLTQINNNTPPSVDLQPAIDLATQIRQSLENTAQQANVGGEPTQPTDATNDSGNSTGDTTTTQQDSAGSADAGSAASSDSTAPSGGEADVPQPTSPSE
jgi:hypothetical protein